MSAPNSLCKYDNLFILFNALSRYRKDCRSIRRRVLRNHTRVWSAHTSLFRTFPGCALWDFSCLPNHFCASGRPVRQELPAGRDTWLWCPRRCSTTEEICVWHEREALDWAAETVVYPFQIANSIDLWNSLARALRRWICRCLPYTIICSAWTSNVRIAIGCSDGRGRGLRGKPSSNAGTTLRAGDWSKEIFRKEDPWLPKW